MSKSNFEWDEAKNLENQKKHGVSFYNAQHAFKDEQRVIAEDTLHSQAEKDFEQKQRETVRQLLAIDALTLTDEQIAETFKLAVEDVAQLRLEHQH